MALQNEVAPPSRVAERVLPSAAAVPGQDSLGANVEMSGSKRKAPSSGSDGGGGTAVASGAGTGAASALAVGNDNGDNNSVKKRRIGLETAADSPDAQDENEKMTTKTKKKKKKKKKKKRKNKNDGWNKDEDMLILKKFQAVGDSKEMWADLAVTLQSHSIGAMKERVQYLLALLAGK